MANEILGVPPQMDQENTASPEVVAKDLGGGWWSIEAPWLEEPEKVQGAQNAKDRVAELVASADEAAQSAPDPAPTGDDRIPLDIPREYRGTLTKKQAQGMPSKTRIILEENDEIPPTGLFLSVNGRGYMILPGVEVDVPDFLIEVLDHAEKMVPVQDPQTGQVTGWRKRLRYNYRVVR